MMEHERNMTAEEPIEITYDWLARENEDDG
jgi:hypothetical protein